MDGAEAGSFADGTDPPVSGAPVQALTIAPAEDRTLVPPPTARSMVRATRGTSGMVAG